MTMLTTIAILCLTLAIVPATLTVWNLTLIRRPPPTRHPDRRVSALIPARDEAENIGAALDAVLESRGVDFEVIVFDDDSGDETAAIVAAYAARDPRVRLIRGGTLAAGAGCGKPLACQRLAEAARGDVLIFIDADVRLASDALARLAGALESTHAKLVSGVPRQRTGTLSELLIVPMIDYLLYGFLPIALARRFRHASFGAACGQLIAVERHAYRHSGGHAEIAATVHDGVALARLFRRHGHATDIVEAHGLAECRMYRSWPELREGFVKNAHEGLGSPAGIVPWTLILGLGQVVPFVMLPTLFWHFTAGLLFAAGAVLGLVTRVLLARRAGHRTESILLHPAGIALLLAIQWYALLRRWRNRPAVWKGRSVPLGQSTR